MRSGNQHTCAAFGDPDGGREGVIDQEVATLMENYPSAPEMCHLHCPCCLCHVCTTHRLASTTVGCGCHWDRAVPSGRYSSLGDILLGAASSQLVVSSRTDCERSHPLASCSVDWGSRAGTRAPAAALGRKGSKRRASTLLWQQVVMPDLQRQREASIKPV